MNRTITRILSLPLGLILGIWNLSKEGARDIYNQNRFKNSKIDSGCCINENSQISVNTHILKNTIINNSQISSYSYVGKNCLIQNTQIGKFCSIASEVLIGLGKHPTNLISTSTLFYRTNNTLGLKLVESDSDFQEYESIIIGNDVWIGTRAIIMDGVQIGNGAIIAANSVVTKNVPAYAIVAGVPAKIIKYRFNPSVIAKIENSQWWNLTFQDLKLKRNELNELINDNI